MRILCTGSAGFMGSWIADELTKQGHDLLGVDNLSGGFLRNTQNHRFAILDLRDKYSTDRLIEQFKPEILYHLSASAREIGSLFEPLKSLEDNTLSYMNVLNACIKNKFKKAIFFSSMASFGNQIAPFSEDMENKPEDIYGWNKSFCEATTKILAEIHDFKWTVIKPHNVMGVRQSLSDRFRNVFAIWMNRIMHDEKEIYVFGDGCISKETKIYTSFCGTEKIENLYNRLLLFNNEIKTRNIQNEKVDSMIVPKEEISTIGFDENFCLKQSKIESIHKIKIQDNIEKITLEDGSFILLTQWHKNFVFSDRTLIEKTAKDIKIGDFLAKPRQNSNLFRDAEDYIFESCIKRSCESCGYIYFSKLVSAKTDFCPKCKRHKVFSIPEKLDYGWAYFLGVFVGDGCFIESKEFSIAPSKKYCKKNDILKITNSDEGILTKIKDFCIQKGIYNRSHRCKFNNHEWVDIFIKSRMGIVLKELNFFIVGEKTWTVRIPEVIFKSKDDVIFSFLAGLIDTDGYIHNRRSRISFNTVSKELAEDICGLLNIVGIRCGLRKKHKENKNHSDIYAVFVDSMWSRKLAEKIISFSAHEKKIMRLKHILKISDGSFKQDLVPLDINVILQIARTLKIKAKKDIHITPTYLIIKGKKIFIYNWYKEIPSNSSLQKLFRCLLMLDKNNSEIKKFLHILDNFYLLRVVKKETFFYNDYFYDFSTSTKNYLAGNNGLTFVHNTQKRAFSPIEFSLPCYIKCLKSYTDNKVYNIGGMHPITLNEAAELVIKAMDVERKVSVIHLPPRPNETKIAYCTYQKSVEELGYKEDKDLLSCLKEMASWAKSLGAQDWTTDKLELYNEKAPAIWK